MNTNDFTLKVEKVSKQFGENMAVNDLSFSLRAGRVFGFIGPNGAGKTTSIRMIVGITRPDHGSIKLFGRDISPETRDKIGYLPEERGLYKKMKIVDQLRYFAALKGISRRSSDRRIDEWLERMNLHPWKNKRTTDLSKGMQQKIQFIAAVLHDPDLVILDEPFSGLDPVNVEFMINVLAELKAQEKTIIFSTHLMETAERLCSDILLINRSRKVLSGSLREIKQSYGKKLIALRVEGGNEVLRDKTLVSSVRINADETEVQLASGAKSQTLLHRLVEDHAVITKFEETEPSLNDIFIEQVGERV